MPHPPTDESRAQLNLAALKRDALRRGWAESFVESRRMYARARGDSESEIAAFELAERCVLDDLCADAESVRLRALQGEPSAVTLTRAEQDGYCPSCVQRYYAAVAEGCREAFVTCSQDVAALMAIAVTERRRGLVAASSH